MPDYDRQFSLQLFKDYQGKIETSEDPYAYKEILSSYRTNTNPVDNGKDTTVYYYPAEYGIQKPSSTQAIKNAINPFNAKGSSANLGRFGTVFGIDEISYSDTTTVNKAQITDSSHFAHDTFNFQTDGVVSGNVLYILRTTGDVDAGLYRITNVSSGILTVSPNFINSTPRYLDAVVLKLNPAPLFTVPNSGPLGQEQTFLMTNNPTVDYYNDTDFQYDYSLIDYYRGMPLIRNETTPYRADGPFTAYPDFWWGFNVVLYPDDGTGHPDLSKPIFQPHPMIDSTVDFNSQFMTIDYSNGMIRFNIPPHPGDAINPNSVAGAKLKLWAVYFVLSAKQEGGEANGSGLSRGLLDFKGPNTYSLPSYVRYDTSRKAWSVFSGNSYNDPNTANSPTSGLYFDTGLNNGSNSPRMLLNTSHNQWEFASHQTVNGTGLFLPFIRSANSTININPAFGFKDVTTGQELLLSYSSNCLNLVSTAAFPFGLRLNDPTLNTSYSSSYILPQAWGEFTKNGSSGGLLLKGGSSDSTPLILSGFANSTEITTTLTTSGGCISFVANKLSGSAPTTFGATANLLVVKNYTDTKFIFKGNGDLYINAAYCNYDIEQDAVACRDLSYVLTGKFEKILSYNKEKFESIGLMENGFLSTKNLVGLQLGAIGELYHIVDKICEKLGMSYEELRKTFR